MSIGDSIERLKQAKADISSVISEGGVSVPETAGFESFPDLIRELLASGGGSVDGVAVFAADFSGASPSAAQFYSWEGRDYDSSIYDALSNIQCSDGVVKLTSVYDSARSKWIKQMMNTGGLFESDNFTCTFKAKFCGLPGSWNNVITYGTGTHWTNGMYSDGVKWPAGGEIDAFEQAGGYAENPNTFHTPTVHWGAGTESGYPKTHEYRRTASVEITLNEWHDCKFSLNNGYVKVWIDGELVGENDFSDCSVSNNYLADYKPFMKPQAFYIDGSCASSSNTANVYEFEVSDFKVWQDKLVECESLRLYPQMWAESTELVFPVGAELYLDRVYTPSNTSNKACTWESSNESVATVVQGYVKVRGVGTATITASCGNASAQYVLTAAATANVPCAKVYAEQETLLVSEGKTAEITSYVYPRFTTDAAQWYSSDNAIATVQNGVVTGVAAGTATITVSCGTKSVSVAISVAEGEKPAIVYDFTDAIAKVESRYANWSADKTVETFAIPNKGSLELGGTNLVINESSSYMSPKITPSADEAINPAGTWMWVLDASTAEIGGLYKLNDNANQNQMPSMWFRNSAFECYYGAITKFDADLTSKIIVMGHDESGYYLWIDGEFKGTGGSATNCGYLRYISGLYTPGSGAIKSVETKDAFVSMLSNLKTAVYLKSRTEIETICARDFGYVPSA